MYTTLNVQVPARTTEVCGDVVVVMPTNHMNYRCRNDSKTTRAYKKTSKDIGMAVSKET